MQNKAPQKQPAVQTATTSSSSLIEEFLRNQGLINRPAVTQSAGVSTSTSPEVLNYKNNLRTMFTNGEAKILAIIPRIFNAKDVNGNDFIDRHEQHGTFLNAIERLDEIKKEGFNTLHVLPIHPPGKIKAMGTAGSVYAPKEMVTKDGQLAIDPMLVEPNDPRSPQEQFKAFIDECHKRGIKVMLDLPSCASYDMFLAEPDLMAKERDGVLAKTPQGWNDIRMFEPWADEEKRTLNPKLLEMHKQYVDACIDLGIDGIRSDVARAKPTEFWDIVIPHSRKRDPEFAWLAETYTHECASPQANMPYDRPIDSLRAGFDIYYGQYHIFHEWATASDLMSYVKENIALSHEPGMKGKGLIGSFTTHDDESPMNRGGENYCNLTTALQVTLPMVNPYFVDGYQSGDAYLYSYEDQHDLIESHTDSTKMEVHRNKLDLFNIARKPGGDKPQIGKFMTHAFNVREQHLDTITKGSLFELHPVNEVNTEG